MTVHPAVDVAPKAQRIHAGKAGLSTDFIPGILLICDVLATLIAFLAASAIHPLDATETIGIRIATVIFMAVIFFIVVRNNHIYSIHNARNYIRALDSIFFGLFTVVMLFFSASFAFEFHDRLSPAWVLTLVGLSFAIAAAFRTAVSHGLESLFRRGYIGRRLAVLGAGAQSEQFLRRLEAGAFDFMRLAGVYDGAPADRADGQGDRLDPRSVAALIAAARADRIDDVVVAMPWSADRELLRTVETLKELPIDVYLSTDLVGFELAFHPVRTSDGATRLFEVVRKPISGWNHVLKLGFDYAVAGVAVILAAPLLALIALAVRLDSPGPVIFRQRRMGFNNQEFDILKFRSMHHDPKGERVVRQATRGDPRVTRVGRILRATSLDELPQLFNVLNGTMSLVGPRPHAISHNEEYGAQIRGYFARHKVRPGITGWAQVNGYRGETTALLMMEKRIRHDVYYAENWSIFLDIKILILTFAVVFFQKNAY